MESSSPHLRSGMPPHEVHSVHERSVRVKVVGPEVISPTETAKVVVVRLTSDSRGQLNFHVPEPQPLPVVGQVGLGPPNAQRYHLALSGSLEGRHPAGAVVEQIRRRQTLAVQLRSGHRRPSAFPKDVACADARQSQAVIGRYIHMDSSEEVVGPAFDADGRVHLRLGLAQWHGGRDGNVQDGGGERAAQRQGVGQVSEDDVAHVRIGDAKQRQRRVARVVDVVAVMNELAVAPPSAAGSLVAPQIVVVLSVDPGVGPSGIAHHRPRRRRVVVKAAVGLRIATKASPEDEVLHSDVLRDALPRLDRPFNFPPHHLLRSFQGRVRLERLSKRQPRVSAPQHGDGRDAVKLRRPPPVVPELGPSRRDRPSSVVQYGVLAVDAVDGALQSYQCSRRRPGGLAGNDD
mmetsp:Transcript_19444/g.36392  ORF Transcript_19444/g.36392 Transcript_19444/m.36392 type:complete len:403 (+) Transcript_19444:1483-2691(+)